MTSASFPALISFCLNLTVMPIFPKNNFFPPSFHTRVEQSLSKFYFQSPVLLTRLDISISHDMAAVTERYVHPLHSSQQASKAPGSSLRHATGGGYAVKWHYCHLSVPSASLSLQTPPLPLPLPHPPPPPLPLPLVVVTEQRQQWAVTL